MAELADAIDLGSIAARCGGSSPLVGTLRVMRKGPWPSGKASPLQGEDRRFESDRVHLPELLVAMGSLV